ncbi:hypothetical protein D3C72_1005940 [compost metagenome]
MLALQNFNRISITKLNVGPERFLKYTQWNHRDAMCLIRLNNGLSGSVDLRILAAYFNAKLLYPSGMRHVMYSRGHEG